MTEEEKKFINGLAENMTKNNNHLTAFPLYCIYEIVEITADDSDWTRMVFPNEDYTSRAAVIEQDSWNQEVEDHYRELYGDPYYVKEVSKPNLEYGMFLTEKACQEFIDSYSYRFTKPFVYTHSANGSWELRALMKLIFVIAEKEVPMFYK